MTDNNYDHFGIRKTGAEHLADATAAAGDTAAPHDPATLNFDPVEVSPGMWQLPHETNTHHFFRTDVEARHAGFAAEAKAQREYANYMNALPSTSPSAGQEQFVAYAAGRARAMSEGVTEEAWVSSPEIRKAYVPRQKTGAELMQEYRRNN
ncbi:hypothetical protein J7I84_12515 [Arthrobacter sp. ISL-85]|uniref:hypothetical protein n=1 Tax=Arthrobacter sp. ISL-85 TaxID=2819115 RepID=UPI001BE7F7CF|nr:hypothetical protein [Arthrobacter sp. ISL-85]MBT2567304.1 hypothetical protein [Arthrobacter sp. ISL-85]